MDFVMRTQSAAFDVRQQEIKIKASKPMEKPTVKDVDVCIASIVEEIGLRKILEDRAFFGSVEVTFQNGEVTLVRTTSTTRPRTPVSGNRS
jgi:hypothetical protein